MVTPYCGETSETHFLSPVCRVPGLAARKGITPLARRGGESPAWSVVSFVAKRIAEAFWSRAGFYRVFVE